MYKSKATGTEMSHSTVGYSTFWTKYEKAAGTSSAIKVSYNSQNQITNISYHQCSPGRHYGSHTLTKLLDGRATKPNDGGHRLIIVEMNGFSNDAVKCFHQNAAESWTLNTFTEGNIGIAYGIKALAALLFSLSLNDAQCGGVTREKRIEFLDKHITNLISLQKTHPEWFRTTQDECLNPNAEDHLGATAMRCIMLAVGASGWNPMTDAEFIEKLFRTMRRNRKHTQGNFKFCDNLGGITAMLIARYFGTGGLSLQQAVQKVVSNLLSSVKKYLEISSRSATPVGAAEFFDWFFCQIEDIPWASSKSMRALDDKKENVAFIQAIIECCLNQHKIGTELLVPYAEKVYETYLLPGRGVVGDKKLKVTEKITFPDGSYFDREMPLPEGYRSDGCSLTRTGFNTYAVSGGGTQDFTAVGIPLPPPGSKMTFKVVGKGLVAGTGGRGARALVRLIQEKDFSKMAWKKATSGGGFTVSSENGAGCGDGASKPITDSYNFPVPSPLARGTMGEIFDVTVDHVSLTLIRLSINAPDWHGKTFEMTYRKDYGVWKIEWKFQSYTKASYTYSCNKLTHLGLFFKGLVEISFTETSAKVLKPRATSVKRVPNEVSTPKVASCPQERSLTDMIKDGLSLT